MVTLFTPLTTRVVKKQDIVEALNALDTTQTEFTKLQSITLEEYLAWRDKALGVNEELPYNADLISRKTWLWVFSMQLVCGLRVHEVFAIQNLTTDFITKDGVKIKSLNDVSNTTNLIVIGDKTAIGTTTKTSYRIARPMIPVEYPDLIERLDVKKSLLPSNKPKSNNPSTIDLSEN